MVEKLDPNLIDLIHKLLATGEDVTIILEADLLVTGTVAGYVPPCIVVKSAGSINYINIAWIKVIRLTIH